MNEPLTGEALVDKARAVARIAHNGQFRADGKTPYLVHPEAVSYRFGANWTGDVQHLYLGRAIALLHDVLEPDAARRFTIDELDGLGFGLILPELRLLTHYEGSYLNYILALRTSANRLAIAVKLADMEANLADLKNVPSVGARKGLQIKYDFARWVLLH